MQKKIEDIAFAAANHYISKYPNADGSSTTQFYAKETSKLFLDALVQGSPEETEDLNASEAFPEIVEAKETFFDMFTMERGFLDEALATKFFRPLEEIRNYCTKIRFGNQSFGVESARVAKKVLMDVQKTLTDVEFADFVFDRSQAEALEVMSIFSSALEGCVLRSFSLSLNELAEETIKAFVPLLKSQKMLEELKFNYFYISVEAARAICELLPSIERIKSLHFHYNDSGDDAAETLSLLVKKCIALEDFEFSASEIGTRGAIALAGALSEGSRLKMLNLTDNMFGTKGGIPLSQVVSRHLGLTEVYFRHMNLEDEGVIAIADSLKDAAQSLRVLMIGGNNITSKAAPALAACLAEKKLLTTFSAAGNKLEDVGSIKICKAISKGHEQLRVLDLSANAMTVIGVS
ncbi:hypothetical protein SUGI_0671530 [Cryptomeria japonica]|uniref:RAN GTPase-activating protein 1-like n=1 Tax=Cryptomeria japonica TaxID=3369 RepID=UPI0024149665|nr:RAN GTPase-activating protein 1-like [Cryptomeria japonica]GLJ33384.1 hypothetical protein SUGI_0671530 [Cryptomeria japonica]